MKHLKPFFEALSGWDNINVGELKEFINNSHFVYLMDEGFLLDVFSTINGTNFRDDQYFDTFTYIRIIKMERGSKIQFNWDDIKDHFTPFLEMLIRRYNLSEARLKIQFGVETHGVSGVTTYNVSDIMEDRIKSDWAIKYISIKK
jgi:hypothetical protein